MPTDTKPAIFRNAKFNVEALCRQASALRQGIVCTCDMNQRPAMGSFNWAIFVSFEDGIQWVLRSPHNLAASSELSLKLLASEAATLRYLRLKSDIPVPEVYGYSSTHDNDIGIPYILMSKAPGRPLSDTWKLAASNHPELAEHKKVKVLSQLGAITQKLLHVRLDRIGSLFEEGGAFEVKECLARGHVLHQRYTLEDVPRGPFSSETQFYDSLVTAFTQHAEVLPLLHHCFTAPIPSRRDYESDAQHRKACDLWNAFVAVGEKCESSENRVDYVIAGDALRDMIETLDLRGPCLGGFPLWHPDLSVNNIYVDEDYNITCIIDWGFSSSVPDAILLAPPGLPQFGDELSKDLIASFRDGFKSALLPTVGRKADDYSSLRALQLLQQSMTSWCLSRFLSFDSINDYGLFATLWDTAYGPEKDLATWLIQQRSSPRYKQLYSEAQQEDLPPQEIREMEQRHLRGNVMRSTIARKLTLSSQWKSEYRTSPVGQPQLYYASHPSALVPAPPAAGSLLPASRGHNHLGGDCIMQSALLPPDAPAESVAYTPTQYLSSSSSGAYIGAWCPDPSSNELLPTYGKHRMLDHSLLKDFSPGVSARPHSQDNMDHAPPNPPLPTVQDDHQVSQNLRRESGLFVTDARLWKWLLRVIEETEDTA
ncbi:hypothetical protein IFM47457_09794 [Aspergillus lentulus]|uniref:Aminoglycoside phosphotransferase domain-containing protein n=1 Tax=Aspergillus lentulus TaxID=293939 RepID=A0ABQ1AWQ3_ASPLE|nr:hypothetical protein IFM60648_08733 [Aspergillus lentulus]GFF94175.1 hypothetical protein IFM47457_09794 [Aspergillus lentulus]